MMTQYKKREYKRDEAKHDKVIVRKRKKERGQDDDKTRRGRIRGAGLEAASVRLCGAFWTATRLESRLGVLTGKTEVVFRRIAPATAAPS